MGSSLRAFQSSNGPISHAKPHLMARSTASGSSEISGILEDVAGNVDEDIQADHIDRAESRRLGSANQGSRQPVNFFDRESALPHQLNGLQRSKQADPIRDEIGGVFRAHDPFAQDD